MLVAAGLPETLFLTTPMAAILAVLMGYGRLAADNELTAFRVAGFSLTSLVLPALIASLLLSGGLVGLRHYGQPALAEFRNELLREMALPSPERLLTAESYLDLGPYTIYAGEVDGAEMYDVYLEDRSEDQPVDIFARSGRWTEEVADKYVLLLQNGTMHQKLADGGFRRISFQKQEVEVDMRGMAAAPGEEDAASLRDLYSRAAEKRQNYREAKTESADEEDLRRLQEDYRSEMLEFHRELALPMAPFFLVLVSAPLGMLAQKSGKAMGFVMSLLIIFSYYVLMVLLEPLAVQGWIHYNLALWLPNIAFGGLGTILLYRLWRGK